jgi:CRP-like cAMP-binding protein
MEALRLPSEKLREELERDGVLLGLLQRYTQMVLVQMAQLILCNRAHSLEQRTARWLLQINIRVDDPPFDVTQEFLAEMLGVNRPPVTETMKAFREAGLLTYTRGSVSVDDPDGLERRACECYRTIEDEIDRLLAAGPRFEMGSGGA